MAYAVPFFHAELTLLVKGRNMIEKLDTLKKQLGELATLLNEFKSEGVQLRILEAILNNDSPMSGGDGPDNGRSEPSIRRRKVRKPKNGDVVIAGGRKKAPAGAGAPATLTQLLSGDFFNQARTINDIIEHCKHNLARTFKANEFSGKLGRLVRSGDLTRKKNTDKQYEYKKP